MKNKILGILALAFTVSAPPLITVAPVFAKDFEKVPQQQKLNSYLNDLRTNRNPNVRARAASYLGVLKNPKALDALHSSLVSDVSEQVRINSANAIARINSKPSAKKLLQAIGSNRGKTDVQIAIIRALGDMRSNTKEFVPVIMRFLRSPSPYVREAVVEALWKIQDPRSVKVMNALIDREKELVVKLTLMRYIADFKSPESIPLLRKRARDPKEHLDVRSLARDAIDKLEAMGL